MNRDCDKDEAEVYQGLKARQEWAVKCLYQKYFSSATLPVSQNNGSMADRRDTFQEAVLIFLKKINDGSYEFQEHKMGAYLRRIVHLKWRNQQRKNKHVPLKDSIAEQLSFDGDTAILQSFEREEQGKRYAKLMLLLSDKCKDILMQRYREQVSEKVLAKKWGFSSTKALQVARRRCLLNLKAQVNPLSA